jgi:hypothetical protein
LLLYKDKYDLRRRKKKQIELICSLIKEHNNLLIDHLFDQLDVMMNNHVDIHFEVQVDQNFEMKLVWLV